jgi:hypothetical protein
LKILSGTYHLKDKGYKIKDNIKINLTQIGYVLDSNDSGQDPMVSFSEHGNEPKTYINYGELLDHLSNYKIFSEIVN